MGNVQLMLGDCLQLLKTLPDGCVDAVVTDPPYGIAYDASRSTQKGIQKFQKIAGDHQNFDPIPWLNFPDVILWGCNNYCNRIPTDQGQWYVWDKVTENGLKVRIAEAEFAWHKQGTKSRIFRHLWSGAYRASEASTKSVHPNQKPVKLMKWCLSFLPEGCTVLDPFMGSGTTGVACVQTGRKFIGFEIDPNYFKIAEKRIAAAHKIISGWKIPMISKRRK